MFLRFNSTMEGELLLFFDSFIIDDEAAHENEPRLAVPSCHGRR